MLLATPSLLVRQEVLFPFSASQTAGPSRHGPLTASGSHRANHVGKAGKQKEDLLGQAAFAI